MRFTYSKTNPRRKAEGAEKRLLRFLKITSQKNTAFSAPQRAKLFYKVSKNCIVSTPSA